MLDYDRLMGWQLPVITQSYSDHDCILYAIAVGVSTGTIDAHDLRYLYEGAGLRTLPTMPTIVGQRAMWMADPRLGIDWQHIVHGEQSVQVHVPLPPSGTIVSGEKIKAIYDKGRDKGALVVLERTIRGAQNELLYSTLQTSYFLRNDGGFGGTNAESRIWEVPSRAPDAWLDLPTRSDQAILYRLCGDVNPLHVDRAAAAKAGFPAPILHGLCVYAIAARAVVKTVCGANPDLLGAIEARFSAPTYPGETIRTEIWRPSHRQVVFRCRVLERDTTVLSHGRATIQIS
jgi:acyl dehydratase